MDDEINILRSLVQLMLTCKKANELKIFICDRCPHYRSVDELRSCCFLESDCKKIGIEVVYKD